MGKKVVIIGAVAAGTKAAAKLRRLDQNIQIDIFTQEDMISYSACGLPYFIEDLIKDHNQLIVRTPQNFQQENINVHLLSKCIKIYPKNKNVEILDLESSITKIVDYDFLIMATGARPVLPNIKNNDKKNVFTLRTVHDGINIKNIMKKSKVATIVGAGYIGIELLEAFVKNDLLVNIIDPNPFVMNILDCDIANLVQEHILNKDSSNINLYLNDYVVGLETNSTEDEVYYVHTKNGLKLRTDFVVFATGVVPNSELMANAGAKLGVKNSIKVDEYMKTSLDSIFAAGDCVENFNVVSNQYCWIPLGSTANKEGRIAALNIYGINEKFPGITASAITRYFGLTIATAGLSEKEAIKLNFNPISAIVTKKDKAGYMPDVKNITIKLVADKDSKRILGAQAIGWGDAGKRINTVASSLMAHMTVDKLLNVDLPYAPPYSPAIDPLLTAAQIVTDKIFQQST